MCQSEATSLTTGYNTVVHNQNVCDNNPDTLFVMETCMSDPDIVVRLSWKGTSQNHEKWRQQKKISNQLQVNFLP